jgi:hypothetical protein
LLGFLVAIAKTVVDIVKIGCAIPGSVAAHLSPAFGDIALRKDTWIEIGS